MVILRVRVAGGECVVHAQAIEQDSLLPDNIRVLGARDVPEDLAMGFSVTAWSVPKRFILSYVEGEVRERRLELVWFPGE